MSKKDDRVAIMDSFIDDRVAIMNSLFSEEFIKQKLDEERRFLSGLTKEQKAEMRGERPISIKYADGTTVDYKAGR